jgi:hypothetical protein
MNQFLMLLLTILTFITSAFNQGSAQAQDLLCSNRPTNFTQPFQSFFGLLSKYLNTTKQNEFCIGHSPEGDEFISFDRTSQCEHAYWTIDKNGVARGEFILYHCRKTFYPNGQAAIVGSNQKNCQIAWNKMPEYRAKQIDQLGSDLAKIYHEYSEHLLPRGEWRSVSKLVSMASDMKDNLGKLCPKR